MQEIISWLDSKNIEYKYVEHEATKTSQESADARGEDISIGGKALLLKVGENFMLFVMSAAKKLDSKAIKNKFKVKKVRFASAEELFEITGLVPGSVPPFGLPVFDYYLYVDESIMSNNKIAFNVASLTSSVVMSVGDYLKLANPEVFLFSK